LSFCKRIPLEVAAEKYNPETQKMPPYIPCTKANVKDRIDRAAHSLISLVQGHIELESKTTFTDKIKTLNSLNTEQAAREAKEVRQ
jgi:hypothetical protein